MPLFDTHTHSLLSYDGFDSRREMALRAQALGLDALCYTDHYELVEHKGGLKGPWDWTDTRAAHREALSLRPTPQLLYGIELGNPQDNPDCAKLVLEEEGLDFAIGSIHFCTAELDREDFYYVNFDSPETCRRYLENYMTALEDLVRWGGFDSLGHIPYPLRYMRERDGNPIGLLPYEERLRALLRQLAQKGKAMEVNSCRSLTLMPEYGWLLRLFREEGGELVTTGSDGHSCRQLGVGIRECNALLEANGFRYVTLYRGRKPCPVRL